jgi:hypothetical protein
MRAVLRIRNFFFGFGSTNFSDSDTDSADIYFGTNHSKVFFQWPTNIFWIQYYEEKFCNYQNMCFFSLNSSICHALPVLLNYRVWIRQKVSDSFGFGSATLHERLCNVPIGLLIIWVYSVYLAVGTRIRSDPDLFVGSGSGNFDRIRIRPPQGAYYQSEKVIFSYQHF